MTDARLDFALDHDPRRLQAWLAERPADAPPWRLHRLDGDEDPASLHQAIRACLRCDPDGILLVGCPAVTAEVAALLARAVETGHAVLGTGCGPDVGLAIAAAGFTGPAMHLPGAEFLAAGPLAVEQLWLDIDRAPRPADLAPGLDRYQVWTPDQPLDAPAPVEAGAALPLHLRACEENSWEPAGTAEVVPVLPDGRVGGALVRCVLGGEDVRRLQEARATVFAARRQTIDDELPDVAAYRLLLDVPAWLGAAAQAAEGVRMLARDGRSPTLHLHG